MGRHSASGEDEDVVAAAADFADPATVSGRHARVEEARRQEPTPVDEPVVSLAEVAADDGPLGLIADQMTEPVTPLEPATDRRAPVAQPVAQPVDEPDPGRPAEPPSTPAVERPHGRGNQSTAADLALLRDHSEVRARVIAAIVVPFVLYAVVLYLIGLPGVAVILIWLWLPLVTAGIVAGSILDAEHRRRRRSG
jgi:hypothetical protein